MRASLFFLAPCHHSAWHMVDSQFIERMNLSSICYIAHPESKCLTGQLDHITMWWFSLLRQDRYYRLLWEGPNSILENGLIYLCFLTMVLGRVELGCVNYFVKCYHFTLCLKGSCKVHG